MIFICRDNGFRFAAHWRYAQSKAAAMLAQQLYSRFGYDDELRLEKAAIGCLGEAAFRHFLHSQRIPFQEDTTDFSQARSDAFDVAIHGKTIDVKVAKKSTPNLPNDHWTYGYPQEQHPASKDYVVVGLVDFTLGIVAFYGWISGAQISCYPVVTHNAYAKFPYETPNHEFRYGDMNKDFAQLFRLCAATP